MALFIVEQMNTKAINEISWQTINSYLKNYSVLGLDTLANIFNHHSQDLDLLTHLWDGLHIESFIATPMAA